MSGGMLAGMQYLNIRHELPQIGVRQQQAMGIKNGFEPAEMHHDYELPVADMAASLVKVDINQYPSRKAYGFLNNTDFAIKYGQKGQQDIQETTSKHTQQGWDFAKNGAVPSKNPLVAHAKSDFWSQVVQWPKWVAQDIPDPEFTVTPSEIKGQMDVGYDRYNITPVEHADIQIQTGSAETYIATEGSIRMWTTEGHYDIYA